jgi:Protein of unknown function (DUF3179)
VNVPAVSAQARVVERAAVSFLYNLRLICAAAFPDTLSRSMSVEMRNGMSFASKRASSIQFASLIACVLLSFFLVAYPVYVIRPFRHQGARELAVALSVVRFRFAAQIILSAVSLSLLLIVWRHTQRLRSRVTASICTLLVIGFGILSRVNIYELMFHPLDRPTFSPATKAKLSKNEEVIAVRVRGEARAYPIRSMSYHHIVNDSISGLPIVATY